MAISKEMEDWFLRGGKRPEANGMQETLPEPPDEIPVDDDEDDGDDVVSCPHCEGENLASEEYCTHCGRPLHNDDDDDDDDDDGRTFSVTMERTVTVRQTATVRVKADCGESAMDRAEAMAEDESDDWHWTDVPNTVDYEDCEAVHAEEAD